MTVKLLTEQIMGLLSLTRGCADSSESTLVKMPHLWKSHVAAHMLCSIYARIDGMCNKIEQSNKIVVQYQVDFCVYFI